MNTMFTAYTKLHYAVPNEWRSQPKRQFRLSHTTQAFLLRKDSAFAKNRAADFTGVSKRRP